MREMKRSTTVAVVCMAGALILSALFSTAAGEVQDPQNAALVYYQVCLLYQSERPPQVLINAALEGEPDASMRTFVNSRDVRNIINLTVAASRMPECEWALVRTHQTIIGGHVSGGLKSIGALLAIQAEMFADEGKYTAALDNALALQRFARHVGDDSQGTWTVSSSLEYLAFTTIHYVLDRMPPDRDVLIWLEDELSQAGPAPWRPREMFTNWRDMEVGFWYEFPDSCVDMIMRQIDDADRRAKLEKLTTTEVLEQARLGYGPLLASLVDILESDRPYRAKIEALSRMRDKIDAESLAGDATALLSDYLWFGLPDYQLHINHGAEIHAVQAALALYRIKAETGQLPTTLPSGLPGDPYSGEDFEYIVTDEGFILRCRAAAIDFGPSPEAGDVIRQFEFEVL